MQLLRGINHHLLTLCADPLNPGENLKVLWMVVETERKEEYEKKKSSSLMGCLWSLFELTINSLCRFPEWRIETNCLLAIQLRSSVPPDKKKKRKEKRDGCEGELPIRLFLKHFLFVLQAQAPWEDPHTLVSAHSDTHTHTPLIEVTILKARNLPKLSHFKIVIFPQLFLL